MPREVPVDLDVTLDHFLMNIILHLDLSLGYSSTADKTAMHHQGKPCFMNMVTYFCTPKQNPLRKVGKLEKLFGKTRQVTGEQNKNK